MRSSWEALARAFQKSGRLVSVPSFLASFCASSCRRRFSSRCAGAMPYFCSQAACSPLAPPACCSRPPRIRWTSLRVTVMPSSCAARCSTRSSTMLCRVSRVRLLVEARTCWYWVSSGTAARWALRTSSTRPSSWATVIRCPPTTAAAPGCASSPQAVNKGAAAAIAAVRTSAVRRRCKGTSKGRLCDGAQSLAVIDGRQWAGPGQPIRPTIRTRFGHRRATGSAQPAAPRPRCANRAPVPATAGCAGSPWPSGDRGRAAAPRPSAAGRGCRGRTAGRRGRAADGRCAGAPRGRRAGRRRRTGSRSTAAARGTR